MFEKGRSSPGQGLTEYAIILSLMVIVSIVTLAILGPAIGNVFSGLVDELKNPASSSSSSPSPSPAPPPPECYGSFLLPLMLGLTSVTVWLSNLPILRKEPAAV
ncbi:hypothetical protein ACFLYP_03370 [Chloroflexota bacterium]